MSDHDHDHDHHDLDDLDRLLHDVVRERAGHPVPVPPPDVLQTLRAAGASRRRRRTTGAALALTAAAVVTATVAAAAIAGLTDTDPGRDRVETADPPSTTTTVDPTGPAIGAPARSYIGTQLRATGDSPLWTADGRPLTYLSVTGTEALPGGDATALLVHDGGRSMIWVIDGPWGEGGTIADAIDLDPALDPSALGTGCAATSHPGRPVVALIEPDTPTGTAPTVAAAWLVTPDTHHLAPLADPSPTICDDSLAPPTTP